MDNNTTGFNSFGRMPYSNLTIVLTVIPVSILIIVIVSGNILVIAAVLWDKRLKSQLQNWLILSLAVADLLVGLLIMPLTLTYELLDYWTLGDELCEIWLASDVLFVTASILNLCAISLDRYWSLTDPIYYATRRTAKRTLLMIGCVWLASFLVCCPLIIGWRAKQEKIGDCFLSEDLGYVLYSTCGSFFIPVVTLLFVYARIYRITRRRAKRNLKRTRRRQEMLQSVETDDFDTNVITIGSQSRNKKKGGSLKENDLQNGITNISGTIGGGLLTVAWNVAAITRGSIDELPVLPLPAVDWSRRPLTANMALERGRFKSLKLPPQSFKVQSPGHKLSTCSYGQGAYNNPGEETVTSRDFSKTDSSFSLRTYDLQRHIGHRRKIMRRRERQATSLLGLIVLSFVGCWMPFFCTYLLRAVCCEPPALLFDIIFWLGYCNSAFNPFIYNYFNPEFRQAFVKILLPKRKQLRVSKS